MRISFIGGANGSVDVGQYAAISENARDVHAACRIDSTVHGRLRIHAAKGPVELAVRATDETVGRNLRVMFAVDDLDDTLARLRGQGAQVAEELG